MTNKTASKVNSVIKKKAAAPAKTDGQGMRGIVERMRPAIEAAVSGTMITSERFIRLVLSTISSNDKLANCTPASFCAAMMSAAQLGLEPNTSLGQAYLIPYGNQCQFQIGYRGLIDLAYRSGQIKKIDAQVVYENDEFEYELGWESKLKHIPAMSNRGNPIGYYALFKTADGGGNFLFMSQEDVINHAKKFSKSFNNGPWKTDFVSMAKKTVLKQLLKYAPLQVEFSRAIQSDETIKNIDIDHPDSINILDMPAEFVIEEEEITEAEPVKTEVDPVEQLQNELNQKTLFD